MLIFDNTFLHGEDKREAMQAIWRQACEFDDADYQNSDFSRERRDKRWFCETYCSGVGIERDASDPIWDMLTTMDSPHEPLALIACVPRLRERFFKPTARFVEARAEEDGKDEDTSTTSITKHLVAGSHGVDPDKTREFLLSTLQTGLSLETSCAQRASPLVVLTDAGQDLDDEMTLVLMRALTDKGLVECKGAVATLAPSRARARLVRGTLNELGLGEIPVAIGSDGGFTRHTATFEDTARAYIAPDDESFCSLSGEDLLMELYASAAPASLELLCIASMKDAAQFVRNHEHLFKEKTRSVTIMGGVMPFEDDDETTLLVPDTVGRAADKCLSTHTFFLTAFSPSGAGAQQSILRRELRLFLSPMPRAQG